MSEHAKHAEAPSLEEQYAAIQEKREAERKRRERVVLETRLRFENELGAEGEEFALVDGGKAGPIVVKRPQGAAVLYKRFRQAVVDNKMTPEASTQYVLPAVCFPEGGQIAAILMERPALLDDLVVALHGLLGANEALTRGKS